MNKSHPNSNNLQWSNAAMQQRIRRRYLFDRCFKALGFSAVALSIGVLAFLLLSLIWSGSGGFFQTYIDVDLKLDRSILAIEEGARPAEIEKAINTADMRRLLVESVSKRFTDITSDRDKRKLAQLFSTTVRQTIRRAILSDTTKIGGILSISLLASDDIDQVFKGNIDLSVDESNRRVKDQELAWFHSFESENKVSLKVASHFFANGDSREPEYAGILGAITGSALTLFITFGFAFPMGVLTAIYLEEFSPQNRLTDIIEVNINNLAAVPSIIYGLLGLSLFLGVADMPRSAPLVGGLTLALMTLPTIIISARAAIRSVPGSLRAAALGLGASPMQVIFHHVLPSAMPGILTGSIIGMARALGETAPLLMIGMVAFIVNIPDSVADAATVLPVQVYLWADSPERAFVEKTSAAILVLLLFLIAMNGAAVWLRNHFEKKAD